jgi:spermidine synthase
MNEVSERKVPLGMFLGIAVISASLLAFQVLLTRVCALRLAFHFGFLIISNSLLGIGASGSFLTLFEGRWRKNPEKWIWVFSVLYVISLLVTWQFARTWGVPEKIKFGFESEEMGQFLQFAVFNLGLAVPFFFGGGAVGLILSAYSHRVNSVYASDLVGAALGCLLCPFLLWPVGAGGTLCAVVILGAITIALVAPKNIKRPMWIAAGVMTVGFIAWMPFFDDQFEVPGKKYLQMTQDRGMNVDGSREYSKWSANSRIDVIESPLPIWVAYGIGKKDIPFVGNPANKEKLGKQKWIMQDGDAGTFVTDYQNSQLGREYLGRTLYSLTASVKKGTAPRVFVIGVGGAPDIWAHKLMGASYIKGIELNRGVLEVHDTVAKEFSKGLLEDPNIELVCDEGRSALMRDETKFDIIQMTGIDTWTSLASGAYVLAENYLYTVEAVQQMYEHLEEGGIIQITRMGANMERLRLLSNVHQAFVNMGVGDMADSIAVVTAQLDGLTSVMIKKGKFVEGEVVALEAFLAKSGHGKLYMPLRTLDNNIVERFVKLDDKQKFIDEFPRRITPTTDDQPYFFNFTRWDQPAEGLQYLDEATEVSQGNPYFLWGQLAFSAFVSLLLIVVPLLFKRGAAKSAHAGRFLVYFTGIGVGFIFLEIALMQKLTLLLGQPLYSIVVTLFSILIFTGIGSFLSGPLLKRGIMMSRMIPVGIAIVTVAIVMFSDQIVASVIAEDLTTRALVAGAMTAPLALLLGMPFAHGVGLLRKLSPGFVPWAWAVNGSASVVGSVFTVIVSMNFGFSVVLIAAIFIYLAAFWSVDKLARS